MVRWNGGYGSPTGWMHSSHLRPNLVGPFPGPVPIINPPVPVPPQFPVGPPLCVTGISYGDSLNVRTGPSTGYGIITSLQPSACVNVLGNWSPNSWTRIAIQRSPGNYTTGYAYGKFLTPSLPNNW
jgi:uncharacterized protein YgiM (DUF1202 family)